MLTEEEIKEIRAVVAALNRINIVLKDQKEVKITVGEIE